MVHLLGLCLERHRAEFPGFAAGLIFLLACYGLAQAINPTYHYDPKIVGLVPLPSFRTAGPWIFDRSTSMVALAHWGALALGFLTLSDLARSRDVRWILLRVIAVTGVTMATHGMVMKIVGSPIIPFANSPSSSFFGTYVYHAHAAAFLNLCWPAAQALTICSLHGDQPQGRAIWINVLFLIFIALFINISKFGHLAALPGVIGALVAAWPRDACRWNPSVGSGLGRGGGNRGLDPDRHPRGGGLPDPNRFSALLRDGLLGVVLVKTAAGFQPGLKKAVLLQRDPGQPFTS